jgi:Serine dehydrogenase proteinase
VSENPSDPGGTSTRQPRANRPTKENQPTKTPMFQAIHAPRYQRQTLIRAIREQFGRPLICYVSGMAALVDRDDTVFFVDLLHNVTEGGDLDLLLHTGGGDIDAAEKLISIVRTRVGTGHLRVIVPDFAKSAGTLMALGGDQIVMSDTSELGPIDPQITLNDGHGNLIPHSVQSYLDAYDAHAATLQKDPDNLASRIMLNKLDPATLKLFEAVRDRARRLAEDQLKLGMFRTGPGNFTSIASQLIDTKRWLTHGQMIGWQDATSIGLTVQYLSPSDKAWQCYWQLYCLQRLAIKDREKLFESEYASLTTDSSR